MARAQNPNIEILEIAVRALGPVCDDLVFFGRMRNSIVNFRSSRASRQSHSRH